MRHATCHECHEPITLANVMLLTETMLIWQCECGTKTHRDMSDELLRAICGPLHPRLPYVAAPNPAMPLGEDVDMTVAWWGLVLHSVCCADDFCARMAHEVAGGSQQGRAPDGNA